MNCLQLVFFLRAREVFILQTRTEKGRMDKKTIDHYFEIFKPSISPATEQLIGQFMLILSSSPHTPCLISGEKQTASTLTSLLICINF